MGVLTLSSVSTFTSCKDYDDDISNLQGQIDKLATADQLSQKVAELQALISSNKSDITSLQSELAKKTTLDEVKAVLADYATKEYVDGADATLQAAIKALETGKVADLEKAVKAAQDAADKAAEDAKAANAEIVETLKTLATKTELNDAAEAAQKAIEALESKNAEDLKKAQDAITETLKSYATKSDVADGDKKTLESLASTIKNASDALAQANTNKQAIADALDILGKGYSKENTVAAAIETIKAQIGTPNKELGTLDSRLAAIESVLNGVKDDDTKLGLATKVTNIENKLKDIIGEYTTMVTEVSLLGSFTSDAGLTRPEATKLQVVSGKVAQDLTFGKAEKDDEGAVVPSATNQQAFVKGTLFNNKNEILVRVNPTNAVLTKASIKLVDSQGNDLDDIFEIGEPKKYEKLLVSGTRASNNTGLWTIPVTVKDGVAQGDIEKKNSDGHILYAVAINNTSSEAAKDRYVASTYDITVPGAKDFEAATSLDNVKIWSVNTMGYDNAVTLGSVRKTAGGFGTPVSAKNGETIKISFADAGNHAAQTLRTQIKYFYVVRDDSHVDKNTSGSSAINAWKSYKYEGNAYGNVVELDPSDPTGELKITINGEVGDEIGFRLFAVNYNGTLTPVPGNGVGGESFVVNVGADQAKASVTGDVLATNPNSNSTGWLPITGTLKDGMAINGTFDKDGIHFTTEFAKDAEGQHRANKNSEIKYVKFTATGAINTWADGATISHKIVQKDADGLVENEIAVSLTKKLPTAADVKKDHKYTWKDEQLENGVFTAYVSPADWTAEATTGSFLLNQVITGLDNGFKITIENANKNNVTQQYTNPLELTNTNWEVTVDKALINGTTEHKTTISYNYGQVTSAKNKNGQYIDHDVTVETVQTVFACPLTKKDQTYAWDQYVAGKDSKGNDIMKDLNYLTFGNTQTVCIKAATYDNSGNLTAPAEYADFLDYIIGTNKYDNAKFGGSLTKLLSGSTQKYVKLEDAKLISAQSGKEDYFNASVVGGKIVFRTVADAQNPRNDVKSWLVIKLKDAFGCDQTYQLPFTVKKRK
mgnify:CR=1 FL=1